MHLPLADRFAIRLLIALALCGALELVLVLALLGICPKLVAPLR